MLQKVSRRTVLRGLGLGAGMFALGGLSGCTQFLKRSESSIPLAPAGASNARLAQLAHEAKEAWKSVLRAQNKIERVDAAELERRLAHAKHKMLQLLDQLDAEGITAQIDQQLRALPEQFEYPEGVTTYYRHEFKDVLTTEQYQKLEEFLAKPGTNESAQHVIREGGISRYWRKKLNEIHSQPLANHSSSSFTSLGWVWCFLITCIAALAAAAAVCLAFGEDSPLCGYGTAVAIGICIGAGIGCAG